MDDRLATVGALSKSNQQYVCQRTEQRGQKGIQEFNGMAAWPVGAVLSKNNELGVHPSDHIDAYSGTE